MSGASLQWLLREEGPLQALCARGLEEGAARAKAALFGRAARALAESGVGPTEQVQAFFVPGRVEVLGKHTDYAGGRSLVAALEQGFCLVARTRQDERLSALALDLGERCQFRMEAALEPAAGHWSNYPMTVARRLARNFGSGLRGVDLAFCSDLPPASGMSSSSALMVATYLALAGCNRLEEHPLYRAHIHTPLELAAYLGTVENGQSFAGLEGDRGVGTFGGSEDHTAMLCSRPGHLGQFAYCPARFEHYIPLPGDWVFAIGFSGVVAEKTGAARDLYNRASARAAALVEVWRRHTGGREVYLADALASAPDALERLSRALDEDLEVSFSREELQRRLEHFAEENFQIVAPAGQALAAGRMEVFGALVDRSQALAGERLENQVPETVALASLARARGAAAASAFGAGFGGSVWALVRRDRCAHFLEDWRAAYAGAFPQAAGRARFFSSQAGPAALQVGGGGENRA